MTNANLTPKTRVFINHVDEYSGGVFSKIFSTSVVGATSEEPEENDSDASNEGEALVNKDDCFQVVGTLKDHSKPAPASVLEGYKCANKEELLPHLMNADVIIYDIISDPSQIEEACWAVSALHAEINNFTSPKVFICVSTVLTWAKSKPIDEDDPDAPFTEEDYRRRRPHPNFKDHISTEKLVIKLGKTNKSKFMTYVLASGLTYGEGESIFHFLFKSAWLEQTPALHCFGSGKNVVPTIHIRDLSSILLNITDSKPKTRYLLAVDEANSTLEDIVTAISKNLGTGKVKFIEEQDALLERDIEQADFDMLLVNLHMDSTYIKERMNINWVAETGLQANIAAVIKEFKGTRGLLPIRACVLGPPGTGKTMVVRQLCEHYKLHHIKIQEVIEEAISNLERSVARADEDLDDEDDGRAQEDQELLETLTKNREDNNGRYDDQYIIQFYKEKLRSMPCQNQGFILDGYPKTYEQAKELFAPEENEDELDEDTNPSYDKTTMPEVVICLDAPDDFLKNRIMHLPETLVSGTHNTEEGLARRLAEYRSNNTEDETVLNYFDELEIHPDHVDITKDQTPNMQEVVDKIIYIIGKPRNYGPTPEEIAEQERIDMEKKLEEEKKQKEETERLEIEEARQRAVALKEWRGRLEEVKRQEQEVLETESIPLRNYLMKHVMPTLSQGLLECCKIRPEDPIDFLAEYLFEHNPQIN